MDEDLNLLTANLAGPLRRETLDGVEYVVAPVSMLVVGVHEGSNGPLYYDAEELGASAVTWNGRPVTVDHPRGYDGQPESANTRENLTKYRVGTILNATFDPTRKRLTADAYIDPEKLRRLAPPLFESLMAGKVGEVSTGLFSRSVPGDGVFRGKPYSACVVAMMSDHLALLGDRPGVCRVADGCGINVNESLESAMSPMTTNCGPTANDGPVPAPMEMPTTRPDDASAPVYAGGWGERSRARGMWASAEPTAGPTANAYGAVYGPSGGSLDFPLPGGGGVPAPMEMPSTR